MRTRHALTVAAATVALLAPTTAMADKQNCLVDRFGKLVCQVVKTPKTITPHNPVPRPPRAGTAPGSSTRPAGGARPRVAPRVPTPSSVVTPLFPFAPGACDYSVPAPCSPLPVTRTPPPAVPVAAGPAAPGAPAAPVVPTVTPAELAQQAASSLSLPKPTPERSPKDVLPDGRSTTYVKLPTWFYVPADQWQPLSTTATAGGVSATATATPTTLTFDPGNGDAPVSCTGPGRAWVPGQDGNLDPAPGGCSYKYLRSSYGHPGGMLTATYSTVWKVSWTGTGGTGGTLPDVITSSTASFAVAEAQAVVR